VTVASTLKLTRLVTHEWTRNNATDVVTTFGQFFTRDFAQLIQTIQPEGLFVAGNLEYRVSRV
jgi:hypothetical protein